MKYFEDKKIVAVTSLCNINDPSQRNKAIFKLVHLIANQVHRIALGYNCLYGFSFAIRKDIYIKAGKINKMLNALDDVDLGTRVKKFGKIQLVRDLPVLTSNRRYKDGLIRGVINYAKPLIELALKKNKSVMDDRR
jgi:hypothetical protein